MQKKEIKIAFYKSNGPRSTWIDRLIAWWTRGPYSHVELIIEKDGEILQCSSSPRDGKVRCKKHILDTNVWDYVLLEVTSEQYDRIIKFYNSINGNKYDWMGILGFILPIQDRTNNWFCSETVANALKINGFKELWKYDPSRISPNYLAYLFGLLPNLDKRSKFITFFTKFLKEL